MTTTTKETPVEALSEEVDGLVRHLHQARTAVAESDARLSEIGAARDALAPGLFVGDEEALSTDAALAQEARELERTRSIAGGAVEGFTEQLRLKKEELNEAHQQAADQTAKELRDELSVLQGDVAEQFVAPLLEKLPEITEQWKKLEAHQRESGRTFNLSTYRTPKQRTNEWFIQQLAGWIN